MSEDEEKHEATERLVEALQERIDYFRKEYKVTYATAIGALEIVKLDLFAEAKGLESREKSKLQKLRKLIHWN